VIRAEGFNLWEFSLQKSDIQLFHARHKSVAYSGSKSSLV